uniref:Uncharacterized protein n=1 Tax=Picea sitchensis TaxID=3332 RepID=A0A6B9XWU1_PICSI|nr:hypothetical protein Q903MT_gene6657 [Picea sitchensis]
MLIADHCKPGGHSWDGILPGLGYSTLILGFDTWIGYSTGLLRLAWLIGLGYSTWLFNLANKLWLGY